MPLAADLSVNSVDSATWAALALVLTIVGAGLTWVAWRRRGLAAGIRGLAWTLVPVAAWLTGTLELAAGIVTDVVDWGARLVFSPTVWVGVVVAGVAAVLWVVSGILRARGIGVRDPRSTTAREPSVRSREADPPRQVRERKRRPAEDDIEGMDDIEAILKKHGI